MMGKRIVLYKIIVAALLLLALWYFCASEFKKLVEKDWIPLLDKYKDQISYEAIDINEYLFQVKIKNLRGAFAAEDIDKKLDEDLGAGSKKSNDDGLVKPTVKSISINFAADGDVFIQYIPIAGYIRKSLSYEASYSFSYGKQNIKWSSHTDNMVVWFRKPIFHKEPLNWDINITSDGVEVNLDVNDKKMQTLGFKDIRQTLSNKPIGDKRATIDSEVNYITTSQTISYPDVSDKDKLNQDSLDIILKSLSSLKSVEELTLPRHDKLKIHIEYATEPYYAMKEYLADSGALSKVLDSIIDQPWLVDASFSSDSQYFDTKASFSFNNKEFTKLGFDFLSESKKPKEFAEKIFVIIYPVLCDFYPDFKGTKQELYDVLIPLFSVKNLSTGVSYGNPGKESYDGSLSLCVNDFAIKLVAQCENINRCSAKNTFLYPKEYASATLHYTQAAIITLANTLLEKENRSIKVDLTELEEPLFDFFDAIDKKGDSDNKLEIDISYDKNANKELSFNGKEVAEVMSDYRVVHLLKKLSEISAAIEASFQDQK